VSNPTIILRGAGRLTGGQLVENPDATAHCDICKGDKELVVVFGDTPVCVDCIRSGLDAASVARYRMRESGPLPWGKVTS
jgi:hypothetical protein